METLGSTAVICTDKTGTITENKMRVVAIWSAGGLIEEADLTSREQPAVVRDLARTVVLCSDAQLESAQAPEATGDPTEIALLRFAQGLGVDISLEQRPRCRRGEFHFDPTLRLMSTVDVDEHGMWLHTKGAPEEVIARSIAIVEADGRERPLDDTIRQHLTEAVTAQAAKGTRIIAAARRLVPQVLASRDEAERDLCFLGCVAMLDPARPEVADAVACCHTAASASS